MMRVWNVSVSVDTHSTHWTCHTGRSKCSWQADPRLWGWADTLHPPSSWIVKLPGATFWAPCCTPCTHDCVATFNSVVGLITDNNEKAYLKEVKGLTNCCQDCNVLLNLSKTKELIVDFGKKHGQNYTLLNIIRPWVVRVDSFKYLGVHITEGQTCTIESVLTRNTTAWYGTEQDHKALQRAFHLAES